VTPGAPSTLWVLIPNDTLYRSTDGGTTLKDLRPALGGGFVGPSSLATSSRHPGVLYVDAFDLNGFFLLRSNDGGNTFSKVSSTGYPGPFVKLVMDPTDSSILVGCANFRPPSLAPGPGIFRSSDGGIRWTRVSDASCFTLAQQQAAPFRLYASSPVLFPPLQASDDHGQTWAPASGGLLTMPHELAVFPGSSPTVYAGTSGFGILSTTTGGR
jgi:photosystem II stability/assembly factor-like uncharacterized protein